MEKKKILFVSQEITPYLPESQISKIGRHLPQGIQEEGKEIRTFMPKYGCINERRNQLHEVIRLSGMNLIINDTDRPLIIKVASIQSARMQVYFIDNEDYFHRKYIITDENGKLFSDNDERTLFFAKGVLETVKKLRWKPDIIHCHGWFSGLLPLMIRKEYYDNPLFMDSKIIYSVYNDNYKGELSTDLKKKLKLNSMPEEESSKLERPNYLNLTKLALSYSDGAIMGSEDINPKIYNYIQKINLPFLDYQEFDEENPDYIKNYSEFYDNLLMKKQENDVPQV